MSKHLFRRAAAAALAVALLATPALADTIGGATVRTNDTGLNLRAGANTDSSVLAEVPDGSFLLVEETRDGWYKVVYNGIAGYVSADYAGFSETLDGTYGFAAATKGTNVNLRAGAGTDAGVVKRLDAAGSALTVTGVAGNWLRVREAGGAEGYIRSDLVSYQSGASPSVAATVGEQIAATAKQYLGYRYTWGGKSPETGFDCSGFANYIYGLYGYSLERVAQSIYNANGSEVGWEELQPGDLMFFGYSARSVTHVGIYAGNGEMIHASTYNVGVILTELEGSRYPRTFVGGKRIVC